MPPRGEEASVDETASCDIYDIISEINDLKLEIKNCDDQLNTLPNIDLDFKKSTKTAEPDFGIIEEPSSNTCEQRGYGRFRCSCGHAWGSSFSYLGYSQSCFTCGEEVKPTEISQISYNKAKTKRRFKPHWKRFSHSFQFCEACKLNQCAWRPDEYRTSIRTFTDVKPLGARRKG